MLKRNLSEISVADGGLYRNAMARYAGHVQLVTTTFRGERRGLAVTAACSVSDSPPTVLVCLNHNNQKNHVFFESEIFALNSLTPRHKALSHAFSGLDGSSMEERFAHGNWDTLVTGAPALVDAAVTYDCRVVRTVPHATHTILIGEVAALRMSGQNQALIYLGRDYHALQLPEN